ncbi:hydrolase [Paraglaciecola sp. 2405UD69-4]|uniref:hydrolase n=1 Tax=Paraglaciecola sp. 2405UD69-4 TaxID=3391836 RepID=UPI0039C90C9C
MPVSNTSVPFGSICKSDFSPAWWARNPNVQTIFPRFFQKRAKIEHKYQKLTLPDGDFINLVWMGDVTSCRGLVVMFHGLEGSIKSHYTNDTAASLVGKGFAVVLMHFRGCGGEINLKPTAYHSGETEDAWHILNWLDGQYPNLPKVAVGFSLGANMLLKLLGEHPNQSIVKAAMAVSVPFMLDECSDSINQGFSKVYQGYLLKSMINYLLAKKKVVDFNGVINVSDKQIQSFKSFKEFDENVTAPLHGFKDADDYYKKCSCRDFLKFIDTPTLILHATDDPFMHPDIVPSAAYLSSKVCLEVSDHGGHVGFMQGTPWQPKIWMHQRIAEFFATYLPINHRG